MARFRYTIASEPAMTKAWFKETTIPEPGKDNIRGHSNPRTYNEKWQTTKARFGYTTASEPALTKAMTQQYWTL